VVGVICDMSIPVCHRCFQGSPRWSSSMWRMAASRSGSSPGAGLFRAPCPVCGVPAPGLPGPGLPTAAFREQVPVLIERLQCRTTCLTSQVSGAVKELCGRAASRLTQFLATPLSYATAPRLLRRIPAARGARATGDRGRGLRLRPRHATFLINAETGRRVDVLPDHEAATLAAWLRGKKGVEVVCRDRSATYAEAIRQAQPDTVHVSDRWHLWRNLCDKVLAEVRAHAPAGPPSTRPAPAAFASRPPMSAATKPTPSSTPASDCSTAPRRLNLALHRQALPRIPEPSADRIAPVYRPTLVDPYRDHLRRCRSDNPAVPVRFPGSWR
jgi:Transposase